MCVLLIKYKLILFVFFLLSICILNVGCKRERLFEHDLILSIDEPREVAKELFTSLNEKDNIDIDQVDLSLNLLLNHKKFKEALFSGNFTKQNEPRLLYYLIEIPVRLSELLTKNDGYNADRINCILLRTSYEISQLHPPRTLEMELGEEKIQVPGDAGWGFWKVAVVSWFSPTFYGLQQKKETGELEPRDKKLYERLEIIRSLIKEQAQSSLGRNEDVAVWQSPQYMEADKEYSMALADEMMKLNLLLEECFNCE